MTLLVTLQMYLLIPFWCASPHLLVIFVFATQSLFKETVSGCPRSQIEVFRYPFFFISVGAQRLVEVIIFKNLH